MKIQFDFDPESRTISNLTVEDSTPVDQKKIRKSKKQSPTEVSEDKPIVVSLLDNKIQLTAKLVELISAKVGDRIVVGYKNEGDRLFPFLGKAECFTGQEGNKLTQSLSVSYRGDQNATLKEHGSIFTIQDMNNGTVKLIGENEVIKKAPITEIPEELKDLISEVGEKFEFDNVLFKI